MNTNIKLTFTSIVTIFFIGVLFFFLAHREHIRQDADRQLVKHALIIANSLWRYEKEEPIAYLRLAAQSNNYKKILVVDESGDEFASVRSLQSDLTEDLMAQAGLLPRYQLETDIIYKDAVIGKISVDWQNRSAFTYLYIIFCLLLLLPGIWFFLRLLDAKKTLEIRVAERTADLKESEERFRTVADFTYDWELWRGRDGNIIYTSPSCKRISGYSRKEFMADRELVSKIVHPEDKQNVKEHYAQCSSGTMATEHLEYRIINKGGEEVWIGHTCTPVFGEDNKWMGRRISNQDISERKLAEEEREKLQKQLTQAQKMEAIGTLAGGIAHDFNNILSAIIGYSELSLSKLDQGAWIHGNMSKILKAGERARDLVQQILTFSRQNERELLPVQIKLVVKEVVKFIRATLPSTIEIRQNVEGNPTVMADPIQIHQIIMNLCTNARHAMEDKDGTLEIGLESLELGSEFMAKHPGLQSGNYVKLTINDTGAGISAENLERVFDPYFSTKEKGKGTGLGLATVHGIVKSHGGTITVESQMGKGTKFEVYLPLAEDNSKTKEGSEPQLIGGEERILLVDDEKDIIEIGKEILEGLGYTVTAADKADKALEIFTKQPDRFDLVISDMTMPKMTGEKLASELIKIRSDIPILLCTGFSEGMSEEKAASLGIKGYLMKPVTLNTLSYGVRKVLDEKLS